MASPPQMRPAQTSQLQRVPLTLIAADRRLAYRDALDSWDGGLALRRSLARAGQLQPVTLRACGETLQLTAGFRRLQALAELQIEEVWAHISSEPAAALFVQAVEEHAGQQTNLRERIRALQIGRSLGFERGALCRLLAALGQPAQAHLVDQHLSVASLPPALLDLLVAKGFSLRRCLPFSQLAASEAELLVQLAATLRLGGRQIEEVSTALSEIAARERRSVAQVIEELALLAGEPISREAPAPEAIKPDTPALLERIARRRLPETYRRRDELQGLCSAFGIGQVRFDPALAVDGVEISLRVQDPSELRLLGEALASAPAAARLAQILAKL